MMEPVDAAKLKLKQNELRTDLIFEDICAPLLQEELINNEDYQRIKCQVTEPEKIDVLLNILPKKGPGSFAKFIKILEKDYVWLSQSLQTAEVQVIENNNGDTKLMDFNIGITREMMSIVRRNHRVNKNWTGMAHTLGLSHRVHSIRSRVNIYCEEADVCVLYLLEDWIGQSPKEATLAGLLYALREENHNDCADELEAKYG